MRSVAVHAASIYDRWYFLATFAVAYVALAALPHAGASRAPLVVLLASPLALAWVWRQTRRPSGLAGRQVDPTALGALRVCVWGLGLWVAARVGPGGRPAFDMAANIGLGSAVVAGTLALARIPHQDGLIRPPRSARSLDAAAFCALLWGVAVALPGARALWPNESSLLDPLATHYATSAASIASVLVSTAAALRARTTRRLELGVADRAFGAIALCLTAFSVAVPATLANLAAADRALPMGALGAALACAWTSATPEPTTVPSVLRGALVVMLLGAPVALIAGALAQHAPELAGVIVLCGCVVAIFVGLLARAVAQPLTPEQSRWLGALHAATRASLEPEPHAAIVATLKSLQGLEKNVHTRPELWRIEPPEALSVDVAGYLHTERGAAPPELYELAQAEPERMLRRDVLDAIQVRRPDVRAVLGWMEARDAFAVTLVCEEQGPLGLLLLPQGTRTRPVTLEEARAARQLSDRLSAVLGVSSSLSRAREREQQARERAEGLQRETDRLEASIAERARPRDLLVEALARGVRVATYSAPARVALGSLERLGRAGLDVTLEVPVGTDALGFACAFHLAGSRQHAPFVIAEGTAARAHSPAHWQGLDAPTSRAAGGTLVVLNVAALPMAAQDALAMALGARPVEHGRPSFALVASVPEPPQGLLDALHVSPALAHFLLPHVVQLPRLSERAEDLRALVLDRLCHSGVRYAGEPLGIEPLAMQLLVQHAWPGNDAELRSVVDRAAHASTGQRVSVADLSAIGFVGPALEGDVDLPAQPRARTERPSSEPVGAARSERVVARRRRRR